MFHVEPCKTGPVDWDIFEEIVRAGLPFWEGIGEYFHIDHLY
jgi:hypothetical protein